jgi:hypothetical protein
MSAHHRNREAREEAARREGQREIEQNERECNAMFRHITTALMFWRACGNRACRRAQGCRTGDAAACFRRFWPHLPEEHRIRFIATVKAQNEGHSAAEAVRIAEARVAAWEELDARMAARPQRGVTG